MVVKFKLGFKEDKYQAGWGRKVIQGGKKGPRKPQR